LADLHPEWIFHTQTTLDREFEGMVNGHCLQSHLGELDERFEGGEAGSKPGYRSGFSARPGLQEIVSRVSRGESGSSVRILCQKS